MLQLQKRLKKILLLLWSVAFYSISEFVCVFFLFQQVKTSGLPNTTSQVASGLLFLAVSPVQPEACCWRTQQLPGWLQGYVDSSEKSCARPLPGSGVPPVPVSLWGVVLVGWPSGCSGLSSVSLVNKTLKKYLFSKFPPHIDSVRPENVNNRQDRRCWEAQLVTEIHPNLFMCPNLRNSNHSL